MKSNKTHSNFNTRTVLALGGLVLLGFLVMSAIDSRKGARITGLSVDIVPLDGLAYMIQPDEIKSIIYEGYRRDVEDLTVHTVDLKLVEEVLEAEPFIGDADVFIDADDQLDIRIYQACPAARIIDSSNRSYYLTEEGQPVPISKHASARVVVFSGVIDDFNVPRDTLTIRQLAVLEMIEILGENSFAQKMIEQVHISRFGEFRIQPKMGNFKFNLGEPVNLRDKIERLELAYKEVLPVKGWDKYKEINLAIDDQIICKK